MVWLDVETLLPLPFFLDMGGGNLDVKPNDLQLTTLHFAPVLE